MGYITSSECDLKAVDKILKILVTDTFFFYLLISDLKYSLALNLLSRK